MLRAILTTVFVTASGLPLLAQQHPFDVHDLLAMQRVSSPAVSPDGKSVVFVVRTTDLEADRGRTDLWLGSLTGGEPRRLTTHEASDFEPFWNAAGSGVLFVSTRSGSAQIWELPLGGGEARQVTDLPLGVANPKLSPDGRTLAFTLEVFPDCGDLACTVDRLEESGNAKRTGVAYDQLLLRHWDTWSDHRRSHLFTAPYVSGAQAFDGEPKDVTRGLEADVPSKPFGGREELTFSPDGRQLVFTARVAGSEEAWSTNFDLYAAPVDGSVPPRNLTAANPAWDTQPVFSPDGKTLAYLAMARAGYESDRFRVVLQEWPSGDARVLTDSWDRSVSDFTYSTDGTALFAVAQDTGNRRLFRIDVATGSVATLVESGTVASPTRAGDGVVVTKNDLVSPAELFFVAADGKTKRQLTNLNRERLANIQFGEFEQFSFAGANGDKVYGWVVEPVGLAPGAKAPIAFLIHGGPQGSFSNNFHYRWNPQIYAGAGYGAVMVDFHGSTGYGQAFTDSIGDDWGGKPLEDLQKGLEAAVDRYQFLDGSRACALGASYGGFMINWIAGNWPDGFRCLVNHDGLFDNRSMYYATEELWFPEWDHRGAYYENPQGHEKHNPVRFVDQWRTPMLVVHGALDYRVPLTQGLATFTALQRRGVPSRLLYFPDENHWVLKPNNSIQWHEEVLGWLARWLRE